MSFSSQWWYLSCGAWRFACCDVLSADTGGLTLSSSGSLSGDSSREVGREGGWGGGGAGRRGRGRVVYLLIYLSYGKLL